MVKDWSSQTIDLESSAGVFGGRVGEGRHGVGLLRSLLIVKDWRS